MKYSTKHTSYGFTLVEMIVSLAVFSVVVTISVGALLILIATNRQLQDDQVVLNNLSFVLDSMTREIRTGTVYYCESSPNRNGNNNIFRNGQDLDLVGDTYQDCANGRPENPSGDVHGVSFIEGGNSITGAGNQRIVYFHDRSDGMIYRRVGAGDAQPITSTDIIITRANFFVTGSKPSSESGSNRLDQPAVTIFIEAASSGTVGARRHQIQTTVVQREIDL